MIHHCYPQTTLNILVSFYSLTWGTYDRHIQDITAKTNHILGLLRRNIRTSSFQLKECAYKSLIWPQLQYTSTVCSPWQRYLVGAIKKVQGHSACYIYNNYHSDSSVSTIIKNLHWDSLEAWRTKSTLVMLYRMFNNLADIPYEHYQLQIQPQDALIDIKILPLSSPKMLSSFFSFLKPYTMERPSWGTDELQLDNTFQ